MEAQRLADNKIKVLVVDDSAVVRQTLVDILNADPDIEVIATAQDPIIAAEKLRKQVPDVITLDVEMPRMDGVTFLQKLMAQHPIPVVICSSLVDAGSETALKAIEAGAIEIIQKPAMGTQKFLEESRIVVTDAVKAAAKSKPRRRSSQSLRASKKLSADAILEKPGAHAMVKTTEQIIVIGASTGGTEAIREVLEAMPPDAPGIVIVQHMPAGFTTSFAKRLDMLCRIKVKEAENGDSVLRGQALIAPGNKHLLIKRSGARYFVEVRDGPLVSRHRPSVDVLFRSAARYAGKNVVAAILTGMGDDGADGMREMHEAGAITVAQDEATSVVYGMPKEAVSRGGVDKVLPLNAITDALLHAVK